MFNFFRALLTHIGLFLLLHSESLVIQAVTAGECRNDALAVLRPFDQETCILADRNETRLVSDPDTDRWYPWSYEPLCMKDPTDDGEYCVYTSVEFNGNTGISFLIRPEVLPIATAFVQNATLTQRAEKYRRRQHQPTSTGLSYKVVELPGKGRGLVAVRPIRRGELIMVDFPAIVVDQELEKIPDSGTSDVGRFRLYKLAFEQLPDKGNRAMSSAATSGGNIHEDILKTNAFGIAVGNRQHSGYFPETAFLNHACSPNAVIRFVKQSLATEALAVKDIAAGEEITISYISVELPSSDRTEMLRFIYNFDCDCPLCTAMPDERQTSDERRARITTIRGLIKDRNTPYKDVVKLSHELLHLVEQEGLGFKLREYHQDLMEGHLTHGKIEGAIQHAKEALKHEDVFEGEDVEVKSVLRTNVQVLEGMLQRQKKQGK